MKNNSTQLMLTVISGQGNESKKKEEMVLPVCTNKLVIEKINLHNKWYANNKPFICNSTTTTYMIDFNEIPTYKRAAWLKMNGKHINYDRSYDYILLTHAIDPPQPGPTYIKKTYSEIRDMVGHNAFDNDKYDLYMYISFTATDVKFDYKENFTNMNYCHSIPFFRSLEKKHATSSNFEMEFGTINDQLYLKIGNSHYDISTNPLLIPIPRL